MITPGYFRTMKIPLLRGRDFTDADRKGGRLVLIISQGTAERFFPGEDPIGRRIDWGEDDDHPMWREIIGIVGDVHRRGLAEPVVPEAYAPLAQTPNRWMVLVARSPRAEALLQQMPGIVASVDPEQALGGRRLMQERVSATIGPQRFITLLLAAFAACALLLAAMGIFGLVSYATSQRTRELGIRMALGSTPQAALRLVIQGGLRLVGAGLGLGLVGGLLVGRALASRVVGVSAFDPVVYTCIPAILGAVGIAACAIPAWRAVRIPPAMALRYE